MGKTKIPEKQGSRKVQRIQKIQSTQKVQRTQKIPKPTKLEFARRCWGNEIMDKFDRYMLSFIMISMMVAILGVWYIAENHEHDKCETLQE